MFTQHYYTPCMSLHSNTNEWIEKMVHYIEGMLLLVS
jgi:hypothetical protein